MGLCEAYDAIDEERDRKERITTLDARFKDEIQAELDRARDKFPDFNSAHEGYAILLEEVEELWAEIKINQRVPLRDERIRSEAVQVAAMAMRFLVDVCAKAIP